MPSKLKRVFLAPGVITALAVFGALSAVGLIVVGGEAALSTTTFCTSCHSMSYPLEELEKSEEPVAIQED